MQSLSDQFLAHQIYLQRYASQEAYKVQPFIRRMIKIIKDEVLKQEGTKLSNAKLRALLKDLNEQLYIVTGEWDAEIISDRRSSQRMKQIGQPRQYLHRCLMA